MLAKPGPKHSRHRLLHHRLQFWRVEFFDHLAQLGQSHFLNLTNALARDTKSFSDFFQRLFALAVQIKTKLQE